MKPEVDVHRPPDRPRCVRWSRHVSRPSPRDRRFERARLGDRGRARVSWVDTEFVGPRRGSSRPGRCCVRTGRAERTHRDRRRHGSRRDGGRRRGRRRPRPGTRGRVRGRGLRLGARRRRRSSVWTQLLAVNLTAAAVATRLVLPHVLAAAPSALVYIGSGAAHEVFANNAAYVASKHGLAGLAGATFLDVRDRDVKVSLVSPGLVAAGAGLYSPAGQSTPERLLTPADVAAAVRLVVTFPARGCPTEIHLHPQRQP